MDRVAGIGGWRTALIAGLCLLVLAAWSAPAARAADSIYWATTNGVGGVRVANLDGSGTPATLTNDADSTFAGGVAMDLTAGKVYWTVRVDDNGDSMNPLPSTIRVGNLDGSGTSSILFEEAFGAWSQGVVVDSAAGKIYWANRLASAVRVANLDGSGTAATLFGGEDGPSGPAIDSAAGKIYWGNDNGDQVRVGNLDGSGTAATLFSGQSANSVAIDPPAGKIYWTDEPNDAVRVANLDGSGIPATLFAGEDGAMGLAIDPVAGKAYWVNAGSDEIRVGNLDGSGTAATLFGSENNSNFPALLRSPRGSGVPAISGTPALGQPLSCSQGSWASDMLGGALYRRPRSFAYEWLLNGAGIPGAAGTSYTPTAAGDYTCRVTATNHAGSTSQTSGVVNVAAPVTPVPPVNQTPVAPATPVATDPNCKRLRKKLRFWQARKRAKGATAEKRAFIDANIADTKRRLKKRGC